MTRHELYNVRELRREIRMDKERLAEMEARATRTTANLSGMPSGSNDGQRMEREIAAIADMRKLIEEKQQRCTQQLIQLERYIQSIPDAMIRQIFVYRFEDGRSWRWIAITMRNSEENVRQICCRYIRDHQ